MEKGSVFAKCLLVWMVAIAIVPGCDDSPMEPMSPPEITYVTAPDSQGLATISGVVDTVFEEEQVLVFNENTGEGVVERLMVTGQFEVQIKAGVGDVIIVQTKAGYNLSSEQMSEVPAQ